MNIYSDYKSTIGSGDYKRRLIVDFSLLLTA